MHEMQVISYIPYSYNKYTFYLHATANFSICIYHKFAIAFCVIMLTEKVFSIRDMNPAISL